MISEAKLYPSLFSYVVNTLLFPLKMIIPQPFIQKISFLKSNYDIRCGLVLQQTEGKLLDIGCGGNKMVRAYKAQGHDGIGVDVYDWGDVDLVVDDTSKLPYENSSFDTITFVACLNHIPNRKDVLKESVRLLKPGGQIVLTNLTPIISAIWHKWAYWDEDQHERGMEEGEVWGFWHKQLRNLFNEAGLEIMKHKRFSWGFNHIYVIQPKGDYDS